MATEGQQCCLTCPFCGFMAFEYGMLLHMEEEHPDVPHGGEAERVQPSYDDAEYIECPFEDCDEVVVFDELDGHLQIHAQLDEADDLDSDEQRPATPTPATPTAPPPPNRARSHRNASRRAPENGTSTKKHAPAIRRWAYIFNPSLNPKKRHRDKSQRESDNQSGNKSKGSNNHSGNKGMVLAAVPPLSGPQRLGKADLGKYHNEKQMPSWLMAHLVKNWGKTQSGVLPVLAQFLDCSSDTKCAYLCDSRTEHVSKLKTEGSFCGYRNIQTISSYIVNARYPGHRRFQGQLPSIFEIQDQIEAAWDQGINSSGRIETGGIKGTRKFIGTPEAQAMFVGMGIKCEAIAFKDDEAPSDAEARLLRYIEEYFEQGVFDPDLKVRHTTLPPIYFQHPGHSLTIIGVQRTVKDELHLLVFDPVFSDLHAITKNVGREFRPRFPDTMLRPYRRGHSYLQRYNSFEILKLPPRDEDVLP